MSVADGGAGYGGEDDEGGGADGGNLTGGGDGGVYCITEINVDDTRPAPVRTRRIMGFHVHAADEARHAGDGDTGGMMTADDKIEIEAVEGEDGVGGGEDNAGDADEDVGVGQEGEEGVDTGGDVEDGEDEVFGHDATAPGAAVPEVETDGTGLGVGGKEVVDATGLLVPEGLEVGEDILLLRFACEIW